MAKRIDIAGEKYGRLTAIRFNKINSHNDSEWLFKCDCGKEHAAPAYAVKNGKIRSCGCLKLEMSVSANTKHGLHETRLYRTWCDMRRRCSDQNRPDWANYGGRGITVCDEWQKDFQQFYDWAMAHGYADGLLIERKNNDRGYCPENCEWVTKRQQNNNTRANHKITAFGRTQNLQQWADESGIGHATILFRLKLGWTPEKAVSVVPVLGTNQYARTS